MAASLCQDVVSCGFALPAHVLPIEIEKALFTLADEFFWRRSCLNGASAPEISFVQGRSLTYRSAIQSSTKFDNFGLKLVAPFKRRL